MGSTFLSYFISIFRERREKEKAGGEGDSS